MIAFKRSHYGTCLHPMPCKFIIHNSDALAGSHVLAMLLAGYGVGRPLPTICARALETAIDRAGTIANTAWT